MVANRLKTCLPSIINENQTGFISGYFKGENTRLVYDTIECCNTHNKKDLLLKLHFSKALDTRVSQYSDGTTLLVDEDN